MTWLTRAMQQLLLDVDLSMLDDIVDQGPLSALIVCGLIDFGDMVGPCNCSYWM